MIYSSYNTQKLTKGGTMKYSQKSATFNVRLDIRSLATIYDFLRKTTGEDVGSVSTLTAQSVELVARNILAKGGRLFETVEEAKIFLESYGLINILNKNALHRALSEESLELDGIDPRYMDYRKSKGMSKEEIEKVAAKARQIMQEKRLNRGNCFYDPEVEEPSDENLNEPEEGQGAILGPLPGKVKK